MTHARRRVVIVLVLLAVIALLDGRSTHAHGYILRSIPQDRAVVPRAPSRIQIWFTENLEPRFSTLNAINEKGELIPLEEVGVAPNNPAQLTGRLPSSLPNGAYVVTVRAAFASDGHVGVETIIFWVGQAMDTMTSVGGRPTEAAIPLEVIWRILTLVPLSVLFGAFLLYQMVLLPGWGNLKYKAGGLPPRVMARLSGLIWMAIVIAGAGSVLALLQQSEALFSTTMEDVIRSQLWSVVLRGTQFGDMLSIRLVLIVLAAGIQAGSQYLSTRHPRLVTLLWSLNAATPAAILGTISLSSHATGSTLWPLLSIVADWLHLLANAAWIGGLVTLTFTLPVALGPLGGAERRAALVVALRRFSVLGVAAVAMMAVTGIYSGLLYVRQPTDLSNTSYGQTLIFKALLIIPLLLIAFYHHISVTHGRMAMLAQRLGIPERVMSLSTSVFVESVVGVGVILVAAVLTATPPPVPPEARARIDPPTQTQTVSDVQVRLSIDPGAAGSNTYTVALSRGDQPLAGAQVRFRVANPLLDKRSSLLALDNMGDGTYFGAGADLERAGEWQALVDALPGSTSLPIRAAFHWQVPDTAPNPTERQATPLNWFAGAMVLAMAGVWAYPVTFGRMRTTRLRPEVVVIATLAVMLAVAITLLGDWFVSDSSQRIDALRNPPPQVVNRVWPDAASLAAGRTIYEVQCVGCHGHNGAGDGPLALQNPASAPGDFRDRLPNKRDEDLFQRIPHANTPLELTDTDRWNVINYLRSAVFATPLATQSGDR